MKPDEEKLYRIAKEYCNRHRCDKCFFHNYLSIRKCPVGHIIDAIEALIAELLPKAKKSH